MEKALASTDRAFVLRVREVQVKHLEDMEQFFRRQWPALGHSFYADVKRLTQHYDALAQ